MVTETMRSFRAADRRMLASMLTLPVLYSFRRCPYAIRARMAIAYAGLEVELREVLLRAKPAAMLAASPKATVPVLMLADGRVIDESLDLMHWALDQADPEGWRRDSTINDTTQLIAANDGPFKHWLDRYKYADRHPERSAEWYRQQAEPLLADLEGRLRQHPWLTGASLGLADIALFPFVRQFAAVDDRWFEQAPYPALRAWLSGLVGAELFLQVMAKHTPWKPGDSPSRWPAPARSGVSDCDR